MSRDERVARMRQRLVDVLGAIERRAAGRREMDLLAGAIAEVGDLEGAA